MIVYLFFFFVVALVTIDRQECKYLLLFSLYALDRYKPSSLISTTYQHHHLYTYTKRKKINASSFYVQCPFCIKILFRIIKLEKEMFWFLIQKNEVIVLFSPHSRSNNCLWCCQKRSTVFVIEFSKLMIVKRRKIIWPFQSAKYTRESHDRKQTKSI
jgi:hypothetical protein